MRRTILVLAVPMVAMVAAAQGPNEDTIKKMKAEIDAMVSQSKIIGLRGGIMGPTVKGAPYSAVEVSESTQMLADGTRIHNENQTSVYRDGEGRVRRETPDQITIMDPVAGATYFLDPKTQTAHKATLSTAGSYVMRRSASGEAGVASTFEVRSTSKDGVTSVTVNGKPVDPAAMDNLKAMDHLKMEKIEGAMGMEPVMIEAMPMIRQRMPGGAAGVMVGPMGGGEGMMLRTEKGAIRGVEPESLGKQTINGVVSEGTRHTITLPAGAIGNDRPIQTVSERWYSPELQTVTMTKHSDPRSGEDTFRLTNVIRGEPSPDLFQVPAGYQMSDRK